MLKDFVDVVGAVLWVICMQGVWLERNSLLGRHILHSGIHVYITEVHREGSVTRNSMIQMQCFTALCKPAHIPGRTDSRSELPTTDSPAGDSTIAEEVSRGAAHRWVDDPSCTAAPPELPWQAAAYQSTSNVRMRPNDGLECRPDHYTSDLSLSRSYG